MIEEPNRRCYKNKYKKMISRGNSNHDREFGTNLASKSSEPDEGQNTKHNAPPKTKRVSLSSGPGLAPHPPLDLKISRAILSLAILLLPVSIAIFVNAVLFGSILPGLRSSIDIAVCFFFLSVVFFAAWMVFWTVRVLWLKVRRRSPPK